MEETGKFVRFAIFTNFKRFKLGIEIEKGLFQINIGHLHLGFIWGVLLEEMYNKC